MVCRQRGASIEGAWETSAKAKILILSAAKNLEKPGTGTHSLPAFEPPDRLDSIF